MILLCFIVTVILCLIAVFNPYEEEIFIFFAGCSFVAGLVLTLIYYPLGTNAENNSKILESNTKKCAEQIQLMESPIKKTFYKNEQGEILQITTITKSEIYSARIKLKDNSYIDSEAINPKKILKNRYLYFIYFDTKGIDVDKENIELDINFEKENFIDFLFQIKDKTKKDIIVNQEELNQIKEYANILSKYDISKTDEGYKVKKKQKYKIISEFEYKEYLKKVEELKEIIEKQGETK